MSGMHINSIRLINQLLIILICIYNRIYNWLRRARSRRPPDLLQMN